MVQVKARNITVAACYWVQRSTLWIFTQACGHPPGTNIGPKRYWGLSHWSQIGTKGFYSTTTRWGSTTIETQCPRWVPDWEKKGNMRWFHRWMLPNMWYGGYQGTQIFEVSTISRTACQIQDSLWYPAWRKDGMDVLWCIYLSLYRQHEHTRSLRAYGRWCKISVSDDHRKVFADRRVLGWQSCFLLVQVSPMGVVYGRQTVARRQLFAILFAVNWCTDSKDDYWWNLWRMHPMSAKWFNLLSTGASCLFCTKCQMQIWFLNWPSFGGRKNSQSQKSNKP